MNGESGNFRLTLELPSIVSLRKFWNESPTFQTSFDDPWRGNVI